MKSVLLTIFDLILHLKAPGIKMPVVLSTRQVQSQEVTSEAKQSFQVYDTGRQLYTYEDEEMQGAKKINQHLSGLEEG